MPAPKYTAYDNNGNPLSGGKLYVYAAGTTTPATTYSDVELTIPNTNPVILDAGARATVFLSPGSYKFIQKTSADVTVWSQDNVTSVAPFNVDLDITGTVGEAVSAGDAVYLETGSLGTAGRWYKTDSDAAATSTSALTIGMVPDAIASGSNGSIRLLGQITLTGPLTVGSAYYLDSVAGAITTVAPLNNARYIGQANGTTTLIVSPGQGSTVAGGGGLDYLQLQVFT